MYTPLFKLESTSKDTEILEALINISKTGRLEAKANAISILELMLNLTTEAGTGIVEPKPTLSEVISKALALDVYSYLIHLIAEIPSKNTTNNLIKLLSTGLANEWLEEVGANEI